MTNDEKKIKQRLADKKFDITRSDERYIRDCLSDLKHLRKKRNQIGKYERKVIVNKELLKTFAKEGIFYFGKEFSFKGLVFRPSNMGEILGCNSYNAWKALNRTITKPIFYSSWDALKTNAHRYSGAYTLVEIETITKYLELLFRRSTHITRNAPEIKNLKLELLVVRNELVERIRENDYPKDWLI